MRASTRTRLAEAVAAGRDSPAELLGNGVLALTIDQGDFSQRYQGIVPLEGETLEQAAKTYFRQSEQIPTEVRLSVGKLVLPAPGARASIGAPAASWRSSCPKAPERMRMPDLPGGDGDIDLSAREVADQAWLEAVALVGTVEHTELLDPDVGSERLLFRLFNEHGVRVFEGTHVEDQCSCSRRAHPRHPRRLHRRGDRRQHRGRNDPRQLRILLEGIRIRPRRSS